MSSESTPTPQNPPDGSSLEESWRWHVTTPEEPAALAGVLRRSDRVFECSTSGRSMGATLPPGSRIRFHCGSNDPRIGDVVVLLAGRSDLLAHRVVGRGRGPRCRQYLLTRGDGSLLCDEPVQRAAVLGIVLGKADGETWRVIPPPYALPLYRRIVAAAHRWAMLATLAIDARLATRLAALSYRLLEGLRAGARVMRR